MHNSTVHVFIQYSPVFLVYRTDMTLFYTWSNAESLYEEVHKAMFYRETVQRDTKKIDKSQTSLNSNFNPKSTLFSYKQSMLISYM